MKAHLLFPFVVMRRLLVLSVGALSLTTSAVSADPLKIAVVDTQRVLNDSVIGKGARSSLQAQIKKSQERLAAVKADFDKQKEELQKQSAVLSGSALEQRKEALQKKQVEFQRAYEDMQRELSRKNDAEISKAVSQIDAAVKAIAQDGGFTFVLERDKQAVVYASERIDITQQVIQSLDKKVGL